MHRQGGIDVAKAEIEDGDPVIDDKWKISKNQLKKVKLSGVYNGNNVYDIADDSKLISKEDKARQEFNNNLKLAEQSNINLAEVYATKLNQNQDIDKLTEMERVKAKRKRIKDNRKTANEDKREVSKN